MRALILTICMTLAALMGIPLSALAGDPVRCTTREDRQMKRLMTTCSDGCRAVSRYDEQFKRWRTEIIKQGPGEKPRGWDRLPVVRR
jgi:hypothetical protein